jgi:hypothetical protein
LQFMKASGLPGGGTIHELEGIYSNIAVFPSLKIDIAFTGKEYLQGDSEMLFCTDIKQPDLRFKLHGYVYLSKRSYTSDS